MLARAFVEAATYNIMRYYKGRITGAAADLMTGACALVEQERLWLDDTADISKLMDTEDLTDSEILTLVVVQCWGADHRR